MFKNKQRIFLFSLLYTHAWYASLCLKEKEKTKRIKILFKYDCKRVSRRCGSYRMYFKSNSPHQTVMIMCEFLWFSCIIIFAWQDTYAYSQKFYIQHAILCYSWYNVIWPFKVTLVLVWVFFFFFLIQNFFFLLLNYFETLSFSFTCLTLFNLAWFVILIISCLHTLHAFSSLKSSCFMHLDTTLIHWAYLLIFLFAQYLCRSIEVFLTWPSLPLNRSSSSCMLFMCDSYFSFLLSLLCP